MTITETARLERETEETRAQLEQTLGELRARMSPGQILDQATGYFRHNGGRAYLSNLRDEVMHNPLPVALVGAGIAWLAISGAMGRRHSNGNGQAHMERDWGETAAVAHDLGHGDRPPTAAQRARQTAEGWVHDASDAMSGTAESWRAGASEVGERASEMGERVTTAYDEAIGRARETAPESGPRRQGRPRIAPVKRSKKEWRVRARKPIICAIAPPPCTSGRLAVSGGPPTRQGIMAAPRATRSNQAVRW